MIATPSARFDRVVGVMVFVIAAVLLTSIGGLGIVAAPVTLPLLVFIVRHHPTRPFRIAGALIGGLTVVEVTWALTYIWIGEGSALIDLIPAICGVVAGIGIGMLGRDRERTGQP